jgi:hypothetical protein
MFSTPTQVNFSSTARNNRTILELIAADRPGLLSEVGKVFKAERVAINGAKIMTVGERAEDVFYITESNGSILLDEDVPAACRTRWCGRSIGANRLAPKAPAQRTVSGRSAPRAAPTRVCERPENSIHFFG